MIPIEVTAHFDLNGELTPVTFDWSGSTFPVLSTGRHWSDESGLHILAMTLGDQVYELVYNPAELTWSLKLPHDHAGLA